MLFKLSLNKEKAKLDSIDPLPKTEKQYLTDELYYRVISEWEYYAFLSLMELEGFSPQYVWIESRNHPKIMRRMIDGNILP